MRTCISSRLLLVQLAILLTITEAVTMVIRNGWSLSIFTALITGCSVKTIRSPAIHLNRLLSDNATEFRILKPMIDRASAASRLPLNKRPEEYQICCSGHSSDSNVTPSATDNLIISHSGKRPSGLLSERSGGPYWGGDGAVRSKLRGAEASNRAASGGSHAPWICANVQIWFV